MHIRDVFTRQCLLGTFGILFSTFGIVFAMFWSDIFEYMMAKEMALRPNSKVFDIWKTPPLPMKIDIYFFNWTNPEDFLNKSTKPILKEVGPYRFIEKPDKVDIDWHPNNDTVSYRKLSMFYFDEEGSKGTLKDTIITLNVVALSAAATARYWSIGKQKTVSVGLIMYEQEIFIKKTANELLFEGYEDDMIDMARQFPIFGQDVVVPFDRFGWFYTRNGSADLMGHFNIYTGRDNIKNIGKMGTWNYKHTLDSFSSTCGMLNGSAGEFYPPKQKEHDSISFFSPDMCRSITLDYAQKVKIEDIEGYKYNGGPRTVDNGTLYPENTCFCNGECVPSGVLNISSCRFGTPVFMSFPHYYNADPYYLSQVEGMTPTQDKHEFYMILEPTTGVALEVAARFQVNILLRPTKNIALYEKVPYTFFPVLWFEQKVTITPDMASEIKLVLSLPTTCQICAGVIIAIGLIMLLWFPIDRLRRRKGAKSQKPKTDVEVSMKEKLPEGSPLLEKNGVLSDVKIVAANPRDSKIHGNDYIVS